MCSTTTPTLNYEVRVTWYLLPINHILLPIVKLVIFLYRKSVLELLRNMMFKILTYLFKDIIYNAINLSQSLKYNTDIKNVILLAVNQKLNIQRI